MRKSVITSFLLFIAFTTFSQLQHKGNVYAAQAGSSVLSNSGDYIYLSHLNALSVYKINQSTGMLTRVQKVNTDKFEGEVSTPYLSADNRFLYASLGKKHNGRTMRTFVMYQVDQSTGKLTFKKNFHDDPQFQYDFVSHFSVSPKRNLMFLGKDESKSLDVYRIDQKTGIPKYINTYETDIIQCFSRFTVSPDQKNLYVGAGNTHKEVVVFDFDETNGQLTKIQEVEHIGKWTSSKHLIISADGQNVYKVDGRDDQKVLQFSRDLQTGMLQYERDYEFKSNGSPIESHFFFGDQNTDFIYGLHSFGDGDAIHVMKRDHTTGNLSYSESIYDRGKTNRLNGVFQMNFSKDNRYAYASGMWDGAVNIFRNPNSRKTIDQTPIIAQQEELTYTHETPQYDPPVQNERPVETRPNTSAVGCTGNELTGEQLNTTYLALASEENDISRLNKAFELLEGKCIKVVQVAALAYLFKSEYQRLQFVKFSSYFLSDPGNKMILADLFQYENMRTEVAQL
ncbi:MAG: beta-propeller fold lactonase family protein [Crocinitomicaceae bacterium]